ncbi:cytosolic carboxypeptidase 3 isoform X10 [Ursus arctos]|uniref:cytosolic carboxypeptidase 3 isoform X10 n=1 Tax=Ursus arctos TaxID=9644 RepID=UPI00254935CA|nr:cytosolic carboxypeptidase 3 isoform X10 [Ursus arctos]
MSEDSEKEDYSDRTISDDESDEDNFMKFVSEDIHRCALLTADSTSESFFPRTTQILLEYQLGRWVPRLREPRDLYGVSSSGPLSPTRWPYHCEVIDEKVQHIDWTPSHPEPVYIPTGLEMEPLYPNSREDTVVYLAEDDYIYLTEIETASERGNTSKGSGRGRSRLTAEEPDVGLDPRSPGSRPEPKADA